MIKSLFSYTYAKNYWKRSLFEKVMAKIKRCSFFCPTVYLPSHCSYDSDLSSAAMYNVGNCWFTWTNGTAMYCAAVHCRTNRPAVQLANKQLVSCIRLSPSTVAHDSRLPFISVRQIWRLSWPKPSVVSNMFKVASNCLHWVSTKAATSEVSVR